MPVKRASPAMGISNTDAMSAYASAPLMVWDLAGRPRRDGLGVTDTPGTCAMCGLHHEQTAPAKKWIEKKSFTDPAHLRARSDRICEACAWAVTGKGMDQIRMWTILARTDTVLPASNAKARFAADHLHFTSRADMRAVVDTLTDPPEEDWVVCVAESGQKHVLPYAHINTGAGRWTVRMDATTVDATPAEFRHVLAHTLHLRSAGHTAAEILPLEPSWARLKTRDALDHWQAHTGPLTPWRGSGLLKLANFVLNRDHMEHYRDRYA